jgi:hypothetical protein
MPDVRMKYEIVGGRLYGQDRVSGVHHSVSLRDVAQTMAQRDGYAFEPDELEVLDNLGTLGWSFGGAFKKAFKKVTKVLRPIVKVAKSVLHNKVFHTVMGIAGAVIPPPAGTVLLVAEAGMQAAMRIAATVKDTAKKLQISKAVSLLANKQVHPSRAGELSKRTGVSPASLKAMALTKQLQISAKNGDRKAQQILKIGTIARSGDMKQAAALKAKLAAHLRAEKANKTKAKAVAAARLKATRAKALAKAKPGRKPLPTQKAIGKTVEQIIRVRSGKKYKIAVSQVA